MSTDVSSGPVWRERVPSVQAVCVSALHRGECGVPCDPAPDDVHYNMLDSLDWVEDSQVNASDPCHNSRYFSKSFLVPL